MKLVESQMPIWQLAPSTLDGLDFDALSRWINIEGGAPPNMVKTLEELALVREQKAAEAERAQGREDKRMTAQMVRASGGAEEAMNASAAAAEAGLI